MDTFIVNLLVAGGCTPKQAAAFERWLEDTRPCGIGVQRLGHCVRKAMVKDALAFASCVQELEQEVRDAHSRTLDIPDLFGPDEVAAFRR